MFGGSRSSPGGLGGLGALAFLGSLGAIAFYVQRQVVPDEHDRVRKAATALPEASEDRRNRPLPWQDRLDFAGAKLVAFQRAVATPAAQAPTAPELGSARLVQELSDGHRVLFTLDPVLQDAALTIFRSREIPYAAAVVLDLRDNAVLTMAGHSTLDPKVDPLEILTTAWAPAASTFKLVTTAALLQKKAVNSNTRVCFNGGLHGFTNAQLEDDSSRDAECGTLSEAVSQSLNLVVGKLALRHLSETELATMARTLLFEQNIGFEFPIERSPAHIPADPKERAKVAAGFWNVDMSPMHGAVLASIFARGGIYEAPHMIAQVLAPDGSDTTPEPAKPARVLAKELAMTIHDMMVSTTEDGTARGSFRDHAGTAFVPGVKVAGKTGSLTGKRAPGLNYNWFIGYAPADKPEMAFAVLLANEPKWRIKAHYAARRLVQIFSERRDAITAHRVARLTRDGVELPERSGQAVAAQQPAPPPKVAPGTAAPARDELAELPPPPVTEPATLPPVPGPLPKHVAGEGTFQGG